MKIKMMVDDMEIGVEYKEGVDDKGMGIEAFLLNLPQHRSCPSCGLHGKLRKCPKCGRDACDKCIAFDNSDCMFCGPHGDLAKECFAPYHKKG